MKKLKCLDTRKCGYITYGRVYDCLHESAYHYEILNDAGDKWDYDKYRFKVIEEEPSDLEELLDIDTDEILESALSIEPVINNNEKVERKMSLKEKILAKIDYKAIAEEVFNIIEDEVVEEVAYDFDETNLACDLVDMYRRDFIETAKEVIIENIGQEIDVDEVTDMLKEVAIDKADEI